MKKKLIMLSIIICATIFIILITILLYKLFIEDEEYFHIYENEKGSYIIYNDNPYYEYSNNGQLFAPEVNPTDFQIVSEMSGLKIGYSIAGNYRKYDAIMLDGSDGNVIVTTQGMGQKYIWVKEGFELPDIFEAKLGYIEYQKSLSNKRISVWDFDKTKVTLNEILDKGHYLITDEDIHTPGVVYFRLADIKSLEIVMGIVKNDSHLYLRFIENYEKDYYYLIKEEYKNLFMPLFEEQSI